MVIFRDSIGKAMFVVISISIGIVYVGCSEVVAKVCYLHQEPDRQGKLRWVQPAERVDRCACTRLSPGGVNMMRPHHHEEPLYTDNPMFTDNVAEIKRYFNCPVDNIPPNIVCPPGVIKTVKGNVNRIPIKWTLPTAYDYQEVPLNVTLVSDSKLGPGSTFEFGNYDILYEATDEAGNSARCTFNISVVDAHKPSFTHCPKDITKIIPDVNSSVVVEWEEPTATDNSGVQPTVVNETPDNGSNFTAGTHIVTYRATDGTGNSQFCTFNIYVVQRGVPLNSVSAWQSTDWTFTARAAFDDKMATVSTTDNNDQHPWWRVALGDEHCVVRITVKLNKKLENRLVGVVARAGLSSNYTGNQQCGLPASDQSVNSGVVRFLCDPPLWATYVHLDKDITSPATSKLEIAEITVEEYTVSGSECVKYEGTILLGSNSVQDSGSSSSGFSEWHWNSDEDPNEEGHCLNVITVTLGRNYNEFPFVNVSARAGLSSIYSDNQQCGPEEYFQTGPSITLSCDSPINASYITLAVQLPVPSIEVMQDGPVLEVVIKEHKAGDCSTYNEIPLPGKDVSQSSTYNPVQYNANSAIDGDVHTFSRTGYLDPHPWWRIDLGNDHCLGIITVSLRMPRKLTTQAKVRAGLSSNFTDNQQCGSLVTKTQSAERRVLASTCDPPVIVRFISIHLPYPGVQNYFEMAEVAVEELSPWECSSYQVVPVIGKIAKQGSSNSVPSLHPAANAIDGDRNTFSRITANAGSDLELWWQVDLNNTHHLDRIIVDLGVNDTGYPITFTGAVARGGVSSNYTQNQQCGSLVTADQVYDGAMITFVCDPEVTARYVSFDMDPSRSENDTALRIAEVTIVED